MSLPLKFTPPQPDSRSLPREELLARMRAGVAPLLLVAPPGFGKTQVALQYSAAFAGARAWLNLDRYDNAPHHFWRHLILALRQLQADLGQGTLELLQTTADISSEILARRLLEEITATLTKTDHPHWLLVLDDFQEITDRDILEGINWLLDYLPPALTVVIASRTLPELHVAHRQGRNRLQLIGIDDLRFSTPECARYLVELNALALSPEDIAHIEQLTKGWAVALNFFATSLHRSSVTHLVTGLANATDDMMDYLFEEVFLQHPPSVQQFLVQTSHLRVLTPALCQQVTQLDNVALIFHYVKQNQLFVSTRDTSRGSYCYHTLLQTMLYHKLQDDPVLWQTVMQRAADWHQQHGQLEEALECWLELKHWHAAAGLLETLGYRYLKQGARLQVRSWIAALPEPITNGYPALLCLRLWAMSDAEKFTLGDDLLHQAETLLQSPDTLLARDLNTLRCELHSLRAIIARLRLDGAAAVMHSERALQYADQAEYPLRWRSYLTLGAHHYIQGELQPATERLALATAFAKEEGQLYGVAQSAGYWAAALAHRGELQRAHHVLCDARDWLEQHQFHLARAGCWRHSGFVEYYRETQQFDSADDYLAELLPFRHDPGCELLQRLIILLLWHDLSMSAGRYDDAEQALSELEALNHALRFEWMFAFGSLGALRARHAVRTDNARHAWQWLDHNLTRLQSGSGFTLNIDRLAAASICRQLDADDTARSLLALVAVSADFGQQKKLQLSHLIQSALLAVRAGDQADAQRLMLAALQLGVPQGYVRAFLDEGDEVRALIAACRDGFGATIPLALLPIAEPADHASAPVSPREQEILRWLHAGLSDKEIARELGITPGTVKTHVRNLYRKLEVKRRTQALSRARELGLLTP